MTVTGWSCDHQCCPTDQGLQLQRGRGPIKYKDGFNPVIQELAHSVEEHQEVCVADCLAFTVAHTVQCLMEPDAHI